MESAIVSEEKDKPVFDEQTLARLLEAAYVLQEHSHEVRALEAQLGLTRNEESPSEKPHPAEEVKSEHLNRAAKAETAPVTDSSLSNQKVDYTATLGRIAEVQYEIEARRLKLNDAMAIIANRLVEICGAAGAAIGVSDGKQFCYRAVAGSGSLPPGSLVPWEETLCLPCLRTGEAFSCPDVNAERMIDAHECIRRGIVSFIAVPVFGHARIVGGIELYYSDPRTLSVQDVQSCQLMAGILTEAIARDASPGPPPLESSVRPDQFSNQNAASSQVSVVPVCCRKCGHELVGEEQFCGQCGAARSLSSGGNGGPVSMQSTVASLSHMKQSAPESFTKNATDKVDSNESATANIDSSPLAADVSINGGSARDSQPTSEAIELAATADANDVTAQHQSAPGADWSSALSAREFLEQIAEGKRRGWLATFWNEHRGDIYLAIAIVLVVSVIRWGLWSNHPVSAKNASANATHKPATPELSLFDRMLIEVGLADAPPAPSEKGNPGTAVWVDLQTGLYYCPGTDMYGKTPRGKYTAQRDAQLDEFVPAYTKVCD